MDESIYNIIRQRRENAEHPEDLLSLLMQARDEDDSSQMNDKQIRDEIATLMLAGHETTANALSWTWMLLAQHPEVYQKLLNELDTVLDRRSPTVEDIPHLRYANMIIKESMRLYPPVPLFIRDAVKDYELGGYKIPAGCYILISQWVMHRHPKYFENPEKFIPERWEQDLEKQLPKGVYIPFGEGHRICFGQSFGMMEAVLLLATIARKFQLTLVDADSIIPQPSITLQPQHGIKVKISQRS